MELFCLENLGGFLEESGSWVSEWTRQTISAFIIEYEKKKFSTVIEVFLGETFFERV